MRFRRRRAIVCQQLVELVTDYLEGDLDPADRAAVEQHLVACDHCTGYVQQVRTMLALTADRGSAADVPDDLLESVLDRYRKRR